MRDVLVIGSNGRWAKDKNVKEARRKAGKPKHYNAYWVVPGTVVTEYGALQFPGDHVKDAPELIEKR